MSWLIVGGVLAGAAVVAFVVVVVREILRHGTEEPALVAVWLVGTTAVLGLASWGLMLLPPVNDAVLGDLPRDLRDFARICEDDHKGEPFPRAASYQPSDGPHPWVVIEDGWDSYSFAGEQAAEPKGEEELEPDPGTVELVACREQGGAVPGTEITCAYSPSGVGPVAQSVKFSQGVYTVVVVEARTGDLVRRGTVKGNTDVECARFIAEGETGPVHTDPRRDAYVDLLADFQAGPSGS